MADVAGEFAHLIGIVPLLWLGGMRLRGRRRDVAFWWLAVAFAVSWLADTAAHWINPDLVGNAYPISQAALIGAVFLDRREAATFLAVLAVAGISAVLWRGVSGADVLLYTVSHLAVVGIVYDRRGLGRLRTSLLVYFGLGLAAWWAFALWSSAPNVTLSFRGEPFIVLSPAWLAWGSYQITRLAGLALFCWAAVQVTPRFHLSTQARR